MSTLAASRVIPLDAVHNFRDLGGYPTTDGRVTRWRRLFRADGLYRLTADDLEVVRELGIHTVLDLRTFSTAYVQAGLAFCFVVSLGRSFWKEVWAGHAAAAGVGARRMRSGSKSRPCWVIANRV